MKRLILSISLGVLLLVPVYSAHAEEFSPEAEAVLRPILLDLIEELQQQISALLAAQQQPSPNLQDPTPLRNLNTGGGEADITDYELSGTGRHDEGDEHARIGTIRFEIDDSDVELKRVEIALDPLTRAVEEDPWRLFDAIHIQEDRDIIGTEMAGDEDDWDDGDDLDGDGGEEYEIRVVTNHVLSEGRVSLDILGDFKSDIEGDEQEWEIFVPNGGILFGSPLGVYTREGDPDERATFKVQEN